MGALGLNLLLALAVLGPGFAVYFGVFSGHATVRSAPPAPNSAASLGLITVGALACHVAIGAVFLVNDLAAEGLRGGVRLPFDPNPYRLALAAAEGAPLDFAQAWCALAFDLLASILAYALSSAALRTAPVRNWVARRLQGWAAQLTAGDEADRVLVAFVLTDTEVDSVLVGYEGVLTDLGLTGDRTIASILLADVTLFHMALADGRVTRVEDPRDEVIPQVFIEGARVRNIAFRRFQLVSGDRP